MIAKSSLKSRAGLKSGDGTPRPDRIYRSSAYERGLKRNGFLCWHAPRVSRGGGVSCPTTEDKSHRALRADMRGACVPGND